jgi:RND family efflux transporter MFP subunit
VHAVGTLVAVQGVQVTSEVPGLISAIHFQSGASVRAGTLLLELDAAVDRARLDSFVAQLEQARADDARDRRLVERGIIATAQAEQSATAVEMLAAQVKEQRTRIDKKRIEAPFTGELGLRLVNLGQFIDAGQPIVTLQSIAPIYVNFALPEVRYPTITRGQAVEVTVDAFPPTVERTLVQVGERRGTNVAILGGGTAGERVVTAGQMKLYDGAPVLIADADAGTRAPPAQPQER